jgi:hypothetical protein
MRALSLINHVFKFKKACKSDLMKLVRSAAGQLYYRADTGQISNYFIEY